MTGGLGQSYPPQAFLGGLPPAVSQSPVAQLPSSATSQMMKPSDPLLELADRMIEQFCVQDSRLPSLIDKMRITPESECVRDGKLDRSYLFNQQF